MNQEQLTNASQFAAQEINLTANDLIACSMGRLPQAIPTAHVKTIILKHLSSVVDEGGWINCKDRPYPDDDPHERLARVSATQNHQRLIVYTHWRPLPAPPKKEEAK